MKNFVSSKAFEGFNFANDKKKITKESFVVLIETTRFQRPYFCIKITVKRSFEQQVNRSP